MTLTRISPTCDLDQLEAVARAVADADLAYEANPLQGGAALALAATQDAFSDTFSADVVLVLIEQARAGARERGVYAEIEAERGRQDAQWGGAEHYPADWRRYREKFEVRASGVFSYPVDVRRAALVKVAALAVAQIEAHDRAAATSEGATP